jgi:hypothetical protein
MAKKRASRSKKAQAPTQGQAAGPVVATAQVEEHSEPRLHMDPDPPAPEAERAPATVINMHDRRPHSAVPSPDDAIRSALLARVVAYMQQSMGLDEPTAIDMAASLDPGQLEELGREAQAAAGAPVGGVGAAVMASHAAHHAAGAPDATHANAPAPASTAQPAAASARVPAIESLLDPAAVDEFRKLVMDHEFWAGRKDEADDKLDDINASMMTLLRALGTKSVAIDQFRVTGYYGVNVQLSKTRLMEKGVSPDIIEAATVRTDNARPTVQVIDVTTKSSAEVPA